MALRIKDSVNLKELEKFGFMKCLNLGDGEKYWCIADLFVGKDRRILQDDGINFCKSIDYKLSEREVEIIYELTKAGLVEKVEE